MLSLCHDLSLQTFVVKHLAFELRQVRVFLHELFQFLIPFLAPDGVVLVESLQGIHHILVWEKQKEKNSVAIFLSFMF